MNEYNQNEMDINIKQIATRARSEQLMSISNSNSLENINDDDRKNYETAMLLIVNDAFDLSSQVNVTMAEKMRIAKTWSNVLIGIIPEERLQDAFDYAFAAHTSAFAINAYNLKSAWTQLQEMEADRRVQEERERESLAREENPAAFCKNRENHAAHDPATVLLPDPYDMTTDIEAPCFDCRQKAFAAWRQRHNEKNAANRSQAIDRIQSSVRALGQSVMLADKPVKNFPALNMVLAGVKCANCGEEIKQGAKYHALSPDFYVCGDCHELVLAEREKENG